MLKGEHIMDKNKNVRLGLIELWKNKARTLGYTQKEVDERWERLLALEEMTNKCE